MHPTKAPRAKHPDAVDAWREIAILGMLARPSLSSYPPFLNEVNILARNFFIRRFFRVAPRFYCALAFCLWQGGFGPRF